MESCRRHGVETRVSCSNCGEPICPRCMVDTPVGMKCPSCAAPPPGVRRARRRGSIRATAAGAGAGALLGVLFAFLPIPFFRGFLMGLGVAEAVLRAGKRQTGGPFLAAGLVGVVAGQLVWTLLTGRPLFDLGSLIAGVVVYFRLR
jgi:hypothetical protein